VCESDLVAGYELLGPLRIPAVPEMERVDRTLRILGPDQRSRGPLQVGVGVRLLVLDHERGDGEVTVQDLREIPAVPHHAARYAHDEGDRNGKPKAEEQLTARSLPCAFVTDRRREGRLKSRGDRR
jgi:hypothetical protein